MRHAWTWIGRGALTACLLVGLPTAAAPTTRPAEAGEDAAARTASTFSAAFVEGRDEALAPLMTATMQGAMTPAATQQLRTALEEQHGVFRRIGPAWREDELQGYRRYRVPATYERETIDFRVVVDAENLVAGFFLVPHSDPPAAESEAPVREVDVEVGKGETALPGTLSLPDGSGPFPGVVLVHGSGPNDRDETIGPNRPLRDLAWGLAERGIAALRYDKRSKARPADLIALGDTLTVEAEAVDDARTALRVLAARPETDAARLYVVGHSLGGTLAPRIAVAEPRPAGLVVLEGATRPLPEMALAQMRYIAGADGQVTDAEQAGIDALAERVSRLRAALDGEAPPPAGQPLGVPFAYWKDLDGYDPAATAVRLGLPVLVIQGGRDYQVTDEDFAGWRAALHGHPGACLVRYPALDHLLRPGDGPSTPADYARGGRVSESLIDDVAAWIRARRCPASADED